MQCPKWGGDRHIKHRHTYDGKQWYQCKDCKHQYVEGYECQHISPETWEMVDKLLLEKLSLARIACVTDISDHISKPTPNDSIRFVFRTITADDSWGMITLQRLHS